MDLEPVEKWKECVELERRRLAAGERPKPLFSNGVQRAGAGEEELQAARTSVEDLQSAVETADWSMESYNYGSDLAVTRAEEALEKARARQEEKLQAAEAERDAAEKKLEAYRRACRRGRGN